MNVVNKMLVAGLVSMTALITTTPTQAKEAFQVSVTRTAPNTYAVAGHQLTITTTSCTVASDPTAILLIDDVVGTLIFDKAHRCAVEEIRQNPIPVAIRAKPDSDFIKISALAKLAANDVLSALRSN